MKEQVEERLRFYDEGIAPTKNVTAMQARQHVTHGMMRLSWSWALDQESQMCYVPALHAHIFNVSMGIFSSGMRVKALSTEHTCCALLCSCAAS